MQVTRVAGHASFLDANTLRVQQGDSKPVEISGRHVVIATGGAPNVLGVPGDELCIDSDGFFELEVQPRRVAVIGAGKSWESYHPIVVEWTGGTRDALFVICVAIM